MSRNISIGTGVSTGSSVGTGTVGSRRLHRHNRIASIRRGTPEFLVGWCMNSYVLDYIIMTTNEVHE